LLKARSALFLVGMFSTGFRRRAKVIIALCTAAIWAASIASTDNSGATSDAAKRPSSLHFSRQQRQSTEPHFIGYRVLYLDRREIVRAAQGLSGLARSSSLSAAAIEADGL
jgi:hypothetical protein